MPQRSPDEGEQTRPTRPLIQLSAYEDLDAIAQRLTRFSGPASAEKTLNKILDDIDLLGPAPYLGPLHQDPMLSRLGYRKLISGRYVVVYRVDDECATVLRVFHGASDYTRHMGK